MKAKTLDLNKPRDARAYLKDWVRRGTLMRAASMELEAALAQGSVLDCLMLAQQLFLCVDKREPLNVGDLH